MGFSLEVEVSQRQSNLRRSDWLGPLRAAAGVWRGAPVRYEKPTKLVPSMLSVVASLYSALQNILQGSTRIYAHLVIGPGHCTVRNSHTAEPQVTWRRDAALLGEARLISPSANLGSLR
jgi:hypothetical protein